MKWISYIKEDILLLDKAKKDPIGAIMYYVIVLFLSIVVLGIIATTLIKVVNANDTLMSWDLEVIQIDGTIHKGTVHLNESGDLVGTLYDKETEEFVQAYGWPSDQTKEMVGVSTKLIQL